MTRYNLTVPQFIGFGNFLKFSQVAKIYAEYVRLMSPEKNEPFFMIGAYTTYEQVCERSAPRVHSSLFNHERLGTLNVLHYTDNGIKNCGEPQAQLAGILLAIEQSGPLLHVLELDITYPDLGIIESISHHAGRGIPVILKLRREVLGEPESFADFLGDYGPYINGILLDMSRPEDSGSLEQLNLYLQIIREGHGHLRIALNCNIRGDDLSRLEPLVQEHPQLSIQTLNGFTLIDGLEFLKQGGKLLQSVLK